MQDLKLTNFSKSTPLHKGLTRPGQTNSLLFSNREAMHHLGHGIESSTDPKGKLLRQLRISHRVDPSLLASQACISLAQLYQIEQGDDSLFYSAALRQQAARRISRLLGVEWDILNSTIVNISMKNVFPIQLVSSLKSNDVNSVNYPSDQYSFNGMPFPRENHSPELTNPVNQADDDQSFASLLSSASADSATEAVDSTRNAQFFKTQKTNSSFSRLTFFWLALTASLSAIIGFLIEEWSLYQLILPWAMS